MRCGSPADWATRLAAPQVMSIMRFSKAARLVRCGRTPQLASDQVRRLTPDSTTPHYRHRSTSISFSARRTKLFGAEPHRPTPIVWKVNAYRRWCSRAASTPQVPRHLVSSAEALGPKCRGTWPQVPRHLVWLLRQRLESFSVAAAAMLLRCTENASAANIVESSPCPLAWAME